MPTDGLIPCRHREFTLLLVLISLCVTVSRSQTFYDYRKYEGTYRLSWSPHAEFSNLIQFELCETDSVPERPEIDGRVIFFADTLHSDIDPECEISFRRCILSGDSLYFRSQQCFGVSYEFKGHFMGVPSDFKNRPDDPILQGTLLRRKNNRIVDEANVRFLLEEGI